MINFFRVMIIASTGMAQVFSIVFCIGILLKSRSCIDINVFNVCNNQIKLCRVSSFIFAVLYWFMVSGLPTVECLEGYRNIANICLMLGYAWIILGFANIAISVIYGILMKGKDELEIMGKMRRSNFIMGAIFLVMAFILKVD